jgi:carbamoyltransferase
MMILGVSCHYHDAAACLVEDGRVLAAVEEERLTRRKHDASFPERAIEFCLERGGLRGGRLDAMAFYEQPALKLHRILATHVRHAPRGLRTLGATVREWCGDRLWVKQRLQGLLARADIEAPRELYTFRHHESHAASAFYPSPFDAAAILTVDGVGEWAATTLGSGRGREIRLLREQYFPHSLGLLYSAFTQFTGFRVNSGEYKVMGLAPYGAPRFRSLIERELIELDADGFFRLNTSYFDFEVGDQMISERFARLFDGPPRPPESPLTQREVDLARSIQDVVEEVILRLGRTLRSTTGERDLCMAGGVALNCVANGRLLRSRLFDRIWIQPAAGDAGGAVGAALAVWFDRLGNRREVEPHADGMAGALLGPEYTADEIAAALDANGLRYTCVDDAEWASTVASLIAAGQVVALHQGRAEFGPRSLGNRSIVGDARSPRMQSLMNLKVKKRESFRPFAPAALPSARTSTSISAAMRLLTCCSSPR